MKSFKLLNLLWFRAELYRNESGREQGREGEMPPCSHKIIDLFSVVFIAVQGRVSRMNTLREARYFGGDAPCLPFFIKS